jgi:hypothetical protein
MIIITVLGKRIRLTLRAYRRSADKNKPVSARLNRREFEKNRLRNRKMRRLSRYKNRNRYGNNEI